METLPIPLGDYKNSASLDEYRISAPIEIQGLLKQLCDSGAFVTLTGPGGVSYTTLMWTADPDRGHVSFSADPSDPQVPALLDAGEAVAAGYLDSIKVQFDLGSLVMVRGGGGAALNASYPSEVFRFQRRSCFRVKPLHVATPTAKLRHPAIADMSLELRVLDISLTGIALFMPQDMPAIDAGVKIGRCTITLDADTQLDVGLHVHHITSLNTASKGVRLGCEMTGLDGGSVRALQRYIDYTQKRRRDLGAA